MEFLTTPDIGAASTCLPPSSATVPTSSAKHHLPISSLPSATTHNPNVTNVNTTTPAPQHALPSSTPYFPNLDRAGIKNSFQSLFSPSPNVAATPALLSRSSAPAITPFINGMQTPGLVAPSTAVFSNYPHIRSPHAMPASSPNHDQVMTTPYLQAAAKEAVRREFMNMPSYVTTTEPPSAPGERVVPGNEFGSPGRPPIQVMTKTGSTAPSPAHTSKVTPQHADAKVPTTSSPRAVPNPHKPSTPMHHAITTKDDRSQQHNQQLHVPSYFMPHHAQPHPGVVMIGQHGMVMGPPPHGAMYAPPPGVMMIPGGQPVMPQGMMMSAPHPIIRQPGPPVKPETPSERKARIEHEKQELIREFKKKTREAALVRFRQKRRERRFGKLIRYDCRKKLADARPRVKGRFVRIKADEDDLSEGPQVVPNLER